ncbi:MAG TPA: hypothetical protein DCZ69_05530 [Syntrophobacteraceae bacterium]|nr:hypothetical protein [Syntrophobacteraceae bacterium]
MKDEKDSQNQDTSALELQIEQMIDELFVSSEEPVADGAQAAPETPDGDQGTIVIDQSTLVFPSETKEVGTAIDFVSMPAEPPHEKPSLEADLQARSGPAMMETDIGIAAGVAGVQMLPVAATALEEAATGLQAASVADSVDELAPAGKPADSIGQQLYNSLKENILSVEWEISPQNIDRFLDAMKPVQQHLAGNSSAMKATSMMVGVLNYIRRIGRSALPLCIQVLQNGVDFLGTLLLPEEDTNGEKRKERLGVFVDHYRVLKFQIEQQSGKVQAPKAKPVSARPGITPELTEYIKSVVDETVRSVVDATLEGEVRRLKQEISEMFAHEARSAPAPVAAVEPTPVAVVEPPETVKEEVLTVSLGEQHFNIPKPMVANVYSPAPRKLAKVLENRSFRISDLLSFLGSPTKGLMGPLAALPANELRNRSFDLVDADKVFGVPGYLQPRQLILISDGAKGYGLLADTAVWRTVLVPRDFLERMVSGGGSSEQVIQVSTEEYPFLNVAREL